MSDDTLSLRGGLSLEPTDGGPSDRGRDCSGVRPEGAGGSPLGQALDASASLTEHDASASLTEHDASASFAEHDASASFTDPGATASAASDAPAASFAVQAGEGGAAGREPGGQRAAASGPDVNPRWSRAAESLDFPDGPSGKKASSGDGLAQAGTWIWLPQGPGPKTPWRKRHPVFFWGGALLLAALVFFWGRMSVQESPMGGPKIAVVAVDGLILDAGRIVAWMDKVRLDENYKGAILRINSPGGAVGPSQEIYAAAKRLATVKPVVASMGALAASGGYYAALGAGRIVAGPSTLTASIGVKMQIPNIGRLMHTLGIGETTLTTGNLKDAGNAWRDMKPEEEAYFRALIDDMYLEFLETVSREREMPLEKVRELADGRAMTGRQALQAGLVDDLGDMHKAVQLVSEQAGLAPGEARLEEGPPKPSSWLNEYLGATLENALGLALDAAQSRRVSAEPVFLY